MPSETTPRRRPCGVPRTWNPPRRAAPEPTAHELIPHFLAALHRGVPRGAHARSSSTRGSGRSRSKGADEGYRLLAPNRFVLQWVKERFAERIGELAAAAEGHPVPITLAVRDALRRVSAPARGGDGADTRASARRARRRCAGTNRRASIRRFTFTSFVAGKANQLARAAGMQVAEHPTSLQPALRLRRRGARQDTPGPGDRQ